MQLDRCSRVWYFLSMLAVQGSVSLEEAKSKPESNPEQFMNISEKILYWGYPSEEYDVLTGDGYYLSVNRIPAGKEKLKITCTVLLMHGLTLEGSDWVANLPHQSLGFMLADAGYDVWIGNSRGNFWSRRHENLTVDQEEFWNFSFHEMGIYDLPAIVNFILQKTGQEKIYYAGHAQGSTIAFIGFSMVPELAEKIKIFFALGPAYTLHYAVSPLLQIGRLPEVLLKVIFGTKEFCLLGPRIRAFLARRCSSRFLDGICKQALLLVSGFNKKNLNESRSDVYVSIFPDYTSVKNFIHWSQSIKTGKFRYFDYGSKNKEKYNQTTPPFYSIEKMAVPVALWSGGQDWVCQPKEIAELLPGITNLIHYKELSDWTHWDFIWGIDAHQRLYNEILDLMEKHP
ncbi:lipase member M-like [Sceloporus undulatus]|uniref:lipase member M-like n=1 Tax=Sceloporus undulatus TaxID=8520 RepID=UPI001C4B347F|nr:lipase member M-like [Sceloporus undulatus]